jgi:hypothetical protein
MYGVVRIIDVAFALQANIQKRIDMGKEKSAEA